MEKKRLVVDANIVRSAGEGTEPAKLCWDILATIRSFCHSAVGLQFLADEWNNHSSSLAEKWQISMRRIGRHKIVLKDSPESIQLNLYFEQIDLSDAIRKDIHLVIAALQFDKIIISNDKIARRNFAVSHSNIHPALGDVMWVVPDELEGTVVLNWLNSGCPINDAWKLKHLSTGA